MSLTRNEITGILVTFFRDGRDGDYLDALNKAVDVIHAAVSDKTEEACPKCGRRDFRKELEYRACRSCYHYWKEGEIKNQET